MLVHGRPLVYRDDAFGHWWTVSQSAVRSDGVVVATPSLDQDLGLAQAVEDLTVQQSSRKRTLKLSHWPFSHGDPGAMKAVLAPTAPIQARTFLAIISAPLSLARQWFACKP